MAEPLVERVAKIIPRYSMLLPGERVGVAVSGGADSVALLHILRRLAGELKIELMVLHVNHHLRGAESDGDEAFVRSAANSLGLPFLVEHAVISEGNLEQEARRARRAFFARCRSELGLDTIALGHTRSDQAETVLHRLLRGAGLAGLAAMRPVSSDGSIRPLITTSRQEVREWAAGEGVAWREDSSNRDIGFVRNRLRLSTLPTLAEEYNPRLDAALAGTAMLAQAEEDYWAEQLDPIYQKLTKRTRWGLLLRIDELSSMHLAVRRRLIRRALSEIRPEGLRGVDFEHVEAILEICSSAHGHDRVLLPGADALRSFDSLLLSSPGRLNSEPREYKLELRMDEERELPFGVGTICIRQVNPEAQVCDNFKEAKEVGVSCADLDLAAVSGRCPLVVRNWEPGDKLHRSGHASANKIKELFQEHRVRLWERRHWPVVLCGEEIVWVRQFGVSERYRPSGRNSEIAQIVYRSGS